MWKSLTKNKDESPYYINVENLDGLYKVSVTNFIKLWSAVFYSNDIIKIMLDSNKSRRIEANKQRFLKVGLDILNNPKLLHKIDIQESAKSLDISLTQIKGIVFSMDFTLNLCAAEQFFSDVTRRLLQIIEDQHKSETELRKQMEGIRGYLSKIPKEILMRYEKQDIADYNDVKHMQAHSIMESVFGNDSEEGVDLRHILNRRPPSLKPILLKEEPDSTDAGSSTVSSSKPSLPASAIKKEPESQTSESSKTVIPNLSTNGIKPIKEETTLESKKATSSLNSELVTNAGTHLKCESETLSQYQRTPPKKRFNEQEVKTDIDDPLLSSQSEPSLSQRHGVLTLKKKRNNLNY